MTDETATTDLDRVRLQLHDRDRDDLVARLEGAELYCWEEVDEHLSSVHPDLAEVWPDAYADLVLAPSRFEALTDADAHCLGDALIAALGVDQWRVVPGDWPDGPELPATVPARPGQWRGLRFRSQSELRVAKALER